MQELHVVFTGRVQGVFFRANTERVAARKGVTGYVRNLSDRSVEAVFQGEAAVLRGIVDDVVRGQDPLARVDRVETDLRDASADFTEFVILR
jgi:acylphosphatase